MLGIAAHDLSVRYDDGTEALRNVSFEVQAGECVALLGHNGSGKSTLLRAAIGLIEPTAGSIRIGAAEPARLRRRALRQLRSRIGFVFQAFELIGNLSAFHNVLHGAFGRSDNPRWWLPATAPRTGRAQAMACLDRVGLAPLASRRTDTLSGGQQQKLALARMLMQEPDLVLADEPVANLDPKAGHEIMDLLFNLVRERRLTVICSLHQPALAAAYADRTLGLHAGKLVLDTREPVSPAELDALYGSPRAASA